MREQTDNCGQGHDTERISCDLVRELKASGARLTASEAIHTVGALVTLDPDDPFEAVLVDIVRTNRKKRADYATDGDPWSNFRFTAGVLGLEPYEAAVHNVAQKLARLAALKANGRGPENESVVDTYLDMAVYGVIALAIITHPSGAVVNEEW